MELINVSELGEIMDFKVFKDTVNNNGQVKAIVAKGASDHYTRKDIDALTLMRQYLFLYNGQRHL